MDRKPAIFRYNTQMIDTLTQALEGKGNGATGGSGLFHQPSRHIV